MPLRTAHAVHAALATLLLAACTHHAPATPAARGDITAIEVAPHWQVLDTRSRPTARHENALAALDGKLYLLGGRGDRPLEIYDPATRTWITGAPRHPGGAAR